MQYYPPHTKRPGPQVKEVSIFILSGMSQLFSRENDRNLHQAYSKSKWEGQAINNLRQDWRKILKIS